MKDVFVGGVLAGLLAVSGAALADVFPFNPSNDPNSQSIVGVGIERLSVQHCGSQKDVSQVLPVVQGEDTFDIQHRFLKLNETGMPEWVDLQLTGNYSWLKHTMYLNLDDASRTQLLNLIQYEMDQICDNNATLIPRSITIVKNEVKMSGDKKVAGVLQVKAMHHARAGYIDDRVRKFGIVTYTLQLKGGLN